MSATEATASEGVTRAGTRSEATGSLEVTEETVVNGARGPPVMEVVADQSIANDRIVIIIFEEEDEEETK